MLRHINNFNPNRGPRAEGCPATRPAEFFLDFDPVCPGWPPGQQDATPTDADASGSNGPEIAVITVDDFRRLKEIIRTTRVRWYLRGYPNALERKLRRAHMVFPLDVAADVVTMNSTVRVFDALLGKQAPVTVVYPQQAEGDPDSISVLSPVGTAVLGHRAGQTVGAHVNQSSRRFTIEKILYQPEAAGDLHL
jgi:regulator of nucleoside diphosphate kinase